LLGILQCPYCGKEFKLSARAKNSSMVSEGKLICGCSEYNVKNGLPILLNHEPKHKGEWDDQWSLYSNKIRLWDTDVNEWEENMLKQSLMIKNTSELKGKWILDAGCGPGVISSKLSKYCTGGGLVGVDMSSAVKFANSHFSSSLRIARMNENLHFVQADIQHLPFKNGVFDMVYSAGVLHHIDDTEMAFKSLLRCLKKRGKISIWVYNEDTSIKVKILEVHFRKFLTFFPRKFRKQVLLSLLPLFLIKQSLFGKGSKQDAKEKLLHIYDALYHKVAKRYFSKEMVDLFKRNGLKHVVIGREDESGFSVTGIK